MKKPSHPDKKITATTQMTISGRAVVRVINKDGSIASESEPTKNLILYGGLEGYINFTTSDEASFRRMFRRARAGTDATPNFTTPDGTFARSGTTVSRATGTGVFSAGDVGATIKFASGEEAYITAYTSATQVEVRESGTITAATIVLWLTNQTALVAQIASTTTVDGASTHEDNKVAGTTTFVRIHNFAEETTAVTYNEIGLSMETTGDLTTRLVLENPVNVGIGQSLQTVYTIVLSLGGFVNQEAIGMEITGWPRPYNILTAVHDGTQFDVTFDEDHHYSIGDDVTISNCVPEKIAISTFTSDASEFIVTTSAAHGLSVSDSIDIADASVAGYDGAWTVASVDSTTVFRVTSVANLGAATSGTVRLSTPGTYFNGTWEIASVPTTDSIRITDATIATGVDAGSGDLEGDLSALGQWAGQFIFDNDDGVYNGGITTALPTSRLLSGFYTSDPTMVGLGTVDMPNTNLGSGSTKSNIRDIVNHKIGMTHRFDVDQGVSQTIKGIGFYGTGRQNGELGFMVKFNQNQRKDSGYTLTHGWELTLRPDLSQ